MPENPYDAAPATRTRSRRLLSLDWWLRDDDGKLVLLQPPNPAFALWLVSLVVDWADVFDGDRELTVTRIGQGGLVAWALDEVARGRTPGRRVLGTVVLVVVLALLLT